MSDRKRTSPSMYERSSIFQSSHGSPPFSSSAIFSKDELDEKQRLEKINFEQKMRIYHLEESLKKYQDGEHRYEMSATSAKAEVHDLKLRLEEMQIEVEQRELLMVKASGVINTLKSELDRCKDSMEKQEELEKKVHGLKLSNEELAQEFRSQLNDLEAELHNTRHSLMVKEQEKSQVDDRLKQTELALAHLQDRIADGQVDKGRVEEKWMKAQEHIHSLEEELTQCRAHVDLYKIRLQEEHDEKEKYKQQVKDHMLLKDSMEERHRARLLETNNQYEAQLRSLKERHDHEIEKIRNNHVTMMADIRENYDAEIGKKQAMMEKTMTELRVADSNELQRSRDDFQARLDEKNEEIRTLRGIIANERTRMETLLQDLENARSEMREKSSAIEYLKTELQAKQDEISLLSSVRHDLQDANHKQVDLAEQLRKETMDKLHLNIRLEQTQKDLEDARRAIKELDAEIHLSKVEVNRLSHVSTELGNKAETVESLARENEKWKILHNKLQNELVEANHKVFSVQKDLEYLQAEHSRHLAENQQLKDDNRDWRMDFEETKGALQETRQLYQHEREQRVSLEAALTEQRALLTPMKNELEECKGQLTQQKHDFAGQIERAEQQLERVWQVYRMFREALGGWDETLGWLLEGDLHAMTVDLSQQSTVGSPGAPSSPVSAGLHYLQRTYAATSSASSPPAAASRHEARHSDRYSASQHQQSHQHFGYRSNPHAHAHAPSNSISFPSSLDLDEFRHESAVLIERLHLKVERASKLKSVFDQNSRKLLKQLEGALLSSQEKASLLQHRVQEAQQEMTRLQKTTARDKELHDQELNELRHFKSVLVQEHSAQLKDQETRYNQLRDEREAERSQKEHIQRQYDRAVDEVQQLKTANAQLKEELVALEEAEEVLQDLVQRFERLFQEKRAQQKELAVCQQELSTLQQQMQQQTQLQQALQQELERGNGLLVAKEDTIQDCEQRLQRLQREVERLRARQIDPDLAMALMDTQSQLQQQHNASRGNHAQYAQQVDKDTLLVLDQRLHELIAASEHALQRFDQLTLAVTTGNSLWREQTLELKAEVKLLLQENGQLVQRVAQLLQVLPYHQQSARASSPPALLRHSSHSHSHNQHQHSLSHTHNNLIGSRTGPLNSNLGLSYSQSSAQPPSVPDHSQNDFYQTNSHHGASNGTQLLSGRHSTSAYLPVQPSNQHQLFSRSTAAGSNMSLDDLRTHPSYQLPQPQTMHTHHPHQLHQSSSHISSSNYNPPYTSLQSRGAPLPSSPEPEELIVYGQHRHSSFLRTTAAPSANVAAASAAVSMKSASGMSGVSGGNINAPPTISTSVSTLGSGHARKKQKTPPTSPPSDREGSEDTQQFQQDVVDEIRRRVSSLSSKRSGPSTGKNAATVSASQAVEATSSSSPTVVSGNNSKKRLSKLDKSLQQLAKKLDAFDLGR